MEVGRNEKCPCGSGLKYKKCCMNSTKVVEKPNSEELRHNYFIVFDKNKERELSPSLHLYNPMLADISLALWYCLHMPRHGFDVISSPDSLFVEGDGIHQHNIFIISSELEEPNINLIKTYSPALYISEDSCYQEAMKINDEIPSKLGCVSIQNLSSTMLSEHWGIIKERVRNTLKDINIQMLDVSPRLLDENERAALPNIFLSNQNGDTEEMLKLLESQCYSFESRSYVTKKQLTMFNLFHQLGRSLEKVSNAEISNAINEAFAYTPCPLVLTLPGGPTSRRSYGVNYTNYTINKDEKTLVDFFGLQRAISQQGVWLEGSLLPSINFSRLAVLEKHFHARQQKSKYIIRTLREFGQELVNCLGIHNLGEYIQTFSKIIAFTDFPIGLAILPGYSDPLCSMISISYRPLTPLTSTFKYGLNQLDEYYIGKGIGFKVLIVECLSKTDYIRGISDLGWSIVKNQLKGIKMIAVYYEEIDSIESLEKVLNLYENIDFLVISAHGTYNKEGIAGLSVGGEFWMPNTKVRFPPVVILSACHVAAKGKGEYTINNAFLEAGVLAVLGTLIPVDVKENAMITQRFFQYISETLEGHHVCSDLAEAWKRVVNMNAVSEILSASEKLISWSLTKNKDNKTPYEEYFEEIAKVGLRMGEIHNQSIEILKRIADKAGMKDYLESVLNSQGYISESFFYIFSGYPEKVLIEPRLWMQK